MPRNSEIITDRISKGLCPICGEKSDGKIKLVIDATFGDIIICEKHFVQGNNILKE